jgi:hypothetical protein
MKRQHRHLLFLCALATLSLNVSAQNADKATVARSAELKAQPFSDAATLKTLAENQKLDVLSRKASWMEVRAQDMTGWVKMLSLRFDARAESVSNSDNSAKSFLSLVKTGSSGSTTTTGAKGWSKESFANLSPNPDRFEKMKQLSSNKSDADAFAKQENLKEQEQAYLNAKGGAQ